jgi:hypothetical protein
VAKKGRCYREAMKVRRREAADRPAALAFLAGHHSARVWLITTNDNVDALRSYQCRGWDANYSDVLLGRWVSPDDVL